VCWKRKEEGWNNAAVEEEEIVYENIYIYINMNM